MEGRGNRAHMKNASVLGYVLPTVMLWVVHHKQTRPLALDYSQNCHNRLPLYLAVQNLILQAIEEVHLASGRIGLEGLLNSH